MPGAALALPPPFSMLPFFNMKRPHDPSFHAKSIQQLLASISFQSSHMAKRNLCSLTSIKQIVSTSSFLDSQRHMHDNIIREYTITPQKKKRFVE
jgi:hypothetical protein